MTARPSLALVAAAALAALVGPRALKHATAPPFEIGLVRRLHTVAEARGAVFRHDTPAGLVVVRAGRAGLGHESFAGFRLGPPTHVALEGVLIQLTRAGEPIWSFLADEAELRSGAVAADRGLLTDGAGVGGPVRKVEVDLASGTIESRPARER